MHRAHARKGVPGILSMEFHHMLLYPRLTAFLKKTKTHVLSWKQWRDVEDEFSSACY